MGGGVIRKISLGEIANIKLGKNIVNMNKLIKNNQPVRRDYPLISSAMQPLAMDNKSNFDGQKITISTRGNPGLLMWQAQPFWATSLAAVISAIDEQIVDPKYLYYALKVQEADLQMQKEGGGVKALYFNHFKAIKITLVDLATQKQIVNYLDHLNTLVNDMTTGLPAVIKQAQKQYQYYLNQLLRFEKV